MKTGTALVDAGRLSMTMLTAAVAVCGASGCSDSVGGVAARATTSPTTPSEHRIAGLGTLVVRHRADGLVVVDRATGGRRLRLSGMQAGECLSYLEANPAAPPSAIRAACPARRARSGPPGG